MKNKLLSAVMVCALGLVGCGDDGTTPPPDNEKKFNTSAKLLAHLEGKTMVMEGANIPSHPNGYDEDVSANNQCYSKVTMGVGGGIFTVTSDLGTVRNGACDHVKANMLQFMTNNVLIENVQGDGECFDVLFSYTGFAQEGRGKISADGKTLTLELFFKDQAQGIRCANGAVGSGNITVKGTALAGSAQQVYVIQ